jgi:hypothetical protein
MGSVSVRLPGKSGLTFDYNNIGTGNGPPFQPCTNLPMEADSLGWDFAVCNFCQRISGKIFIVGICKVGPD